MSTAWGPQPHAIAVPRGRAPVGRFSIVVLGGLALTLIALVASAVLASIGAPEPPEPCLSASCYQRTLGQTETPAERVRQERAAAQGKVVGDFLAWSVLLLGAVHILPLAAGWKDARQGRAVPMGGCAVLLWPTGAAAYALGRSTGRRRTESAPSRLDEAGAEQSILAAPDPLEAAHLVASRPYGLPGGHAGWDPTNGNYITARPRGGMLVIGPPGSGKTSAVIIPSVIIAPGAVVASSIKGDVMGATAHVRARRGRLWHFDPGGGEQTSAGVLQCRWSPLVSVRTWDDARRIASRMAAPARTGSDSGGGSAHFLDRARDWLEVLLYAARLDQRPIADVADWAATADDEATLKTVLDVLERASDDGDAGARIAFTQLTGLATIPDRERGSILSTLARLLRIYSSLTARQLGASPNFDPVAFVRSTDTLYITASPERANEYAPLIAGLVEEIRYAVYARHRAEEEGREPRRPHVTFVLDEANNTAPVPLPAIISEAGGQSLHVIVGIQDLSRARARWGKEADGFLTLFPTKLVLPGVVEPYTLDALSNASGEYDRVMEGYSRSTTYLGQYSVPVQQTNPSWSVQRQKVLHQGDIARLPEGTALFYEGAQWWLIRTGMHWQHPVWRTIDSHAAVSAVSGLN